MTARVLGLRRIPARLLDVGDRFVDDDADLELEDFDLAVLDEEAATVVEVDRHYADLLRVRSYDTDPAGALWSPYGDPDTTVIRIEEKETP